MLKYINMSEVAHSSGDKLLAMPPVPERSDAALWAYHHLENAFASFEDAATSGEIAAQTTAREEVATRLVTALGFVQTEEDVNAQVRFIHRVSEFYASSGFTEPETSKAVSETAGRLMATGAYYNRSHFPYLLRTLSNLSHAGYQIDTTLQGMPQTVEYIVESVLDENPYTEAERLASTSAFTRFITEHCATLLTTDEPNDEELARYAKLEGFLLKVWGFSPEDRRDLTDSWNRGVDWQDSTELDSTQRHDQRHKRANELAAIQQIYALDRTAPSKLHQRFGIRNFSRYTPEAIAHQATIELGDLSDELEVVVTAADALRAERIESTAQDMLLENPIFTEARTFIEAYKRQKEISRVAGAAEIVFFNLHCNDEGNELALSELAEGKMSLEDLRRLGGTARGLIKQTGLLVLAACSAGKRRGIAKVAATELNVPTVAPNFIAAGARRDPQTGQVQFRVYDEKGKRNERWREGRLYTPSVN